MIIYGWGSKKGAQLMEWCPGRDGAQLQKEGIGFEDNVSWKKGI